MFKKGVMRVAENWTIFLVDDDIDEADIYSDVISEDKLPLQLRHFKSADEMLEYLLHNKAPNLIVMDITLPGINGLECLKMLKSNEKYKNIPVIICTSAHHQKKSEESLFNGALSYLVKPANFHDYQILLHNFYNFCSGRTNYKFGKTA